MGFPAIRQGLGFTFGPQARQTVRPNRVCYPRPAPGQALRMTHSPLVALHPASRRRSYVRLQAGVGLPGEDFHLPDRMRSQAHDPGRRRDDGHAGACRQLDYSLLRGNDGRVVLMQKAVVCRTAMEPRDRISPCRQPFEICLPRRRGAALELSTVLRTSPRETYLFLRQRVRLSRRVRDPIPIGSS